MAIQRIYTQEEAEEMASMIDGAYELVELYGYSKCNEHPFIERWVRDWLRKARQFGASSE